MKLCINCYTENQLDAVLCSRCGMSLTRAATGEEAEKLLQARGDEIGEQVGGTESEIRKWPEPPLTASGLVYLFGEEFADTSKGRISGSQTRLVRSGQKVGSESLAQNLILAAFISLAQQGYISLEMEKTDLPLSLARPPVAVFPQSEGADLPPSLEREIMDSISGDPSENRVKAVVGRVVSNKSRADAVKWTVGFVIDALDKAGYLDWALEPGFFEYKVNRWADEEAVAPLAEEAETLKNSLRAFRSASPLLYRRLSEEVAGFGWSQWQEWLLQLLFESIVEAVVP